MTELELKLSLPDQIADQAKAAGLLTSEAIERLVREAIRKAAAERMVEYGRRLREPDDAAVLACAMAAIVDSPADCLKRIAG